MYSVFDIGIIIFSLSLLGILFANNFIKLIIQIEIMLLGISFNFIISSFLYSDMAGFIFCIFILAMAAAESAIALALLIQYYRIYKNINISVSYKFLF